MVFTFPRCWLLRISGEQEKSRHAVRRSQRLLPQRGGRQRGDCFAWLFDALPEKTVDKKSLQLRKAFKQGCFTVEVWEK
jgi:hypothetical protein